MWFTMLTKGPAVMVVILGALELFWTDRVTDYQFKYLVRFPLIGRRYAAMTDKQKRRWLHTMGKIVGVWFIIIGLSILF